MNIETIKREDTGFKKRSPVFFKGENNGPGIQFDEFEDEYIISIETPGLQKKDIEIRLENNMLVVISNQDTTHLDKIVRLDDHCSYEMHQLKSSFALPSDADTNAVTAHWHDSNLFIHFPKKENPHRDKLIKVSIH